MEKIHKLLEEIKKEIVPDKDYLKNELNSFLEKLNEFIKKENIKCDIFVGGSYAKGTQLKGSKEIDIFLRFENLDEIKKLRKIGNYFKDIEVMQGSRPYYRILWKGVIFEVVPIKKIKSPEEAENITDFSPFHVEYVKNKISDEIRKEIILFKAFCKANNCYGAETHIKGLSGYACELLIITLGNFLNLANFLLNTKPPIIIDPENIYKNKREIFENLGEEKTKAPIILIDPTFPKRNVTRALSYNTYAKLLFSLYLFMKKPSREFFKKRSNFIKRNLPTTFIEIKKEGKKDIFMAKLIKKIKQLKRELEINGFSIYDIGYFEKDNKITIYIQNYFDNLPPIEKRIGPPVWEKDNLEKFLKKWKKEAINEPYVEGVRVCLDVKRKYRKIKDFLNFILKKYFDYYVVR